MLFGCTVFYFRCTVEEFEKKYRNQETPIPVLMDAEVRNGLFAYSDRWAGGTPALSVCVRSPHA